MTKKTTKATHFLESLDELETAREAIREARFRTRVQELISTFREGDRLLSKDNQERATPTHLRPSIKQGKKVRRDASINVADDLMDLEGYLTTNNMHEARLTYYRLHKLLNAE